MACNTAPLAFPLHRPGALARAALAFARQYRRTRDLPAALPGGATLKTHEIGPRLAEAEARCESDRLARAPGYRAERHLRLLGALLAEYRPSAF
ncbi:MAG: DUF6477 family protein [Pseudomonadota bacterium]